MLKHEQNKENAEYIPRSSYKSIDRAVFFDLKFFQLNFFQLKVFSAHSAMLLSQGRVDALKILGSWHESIGPIVKYKETTTVAEAEKTGWQDFITWTQIQQ